MFSRAEANTANTNGGPPTAVSMATASPGTTPVRVKIEKTDSSPPLTEVNSLHRPRSLPFASVARLGYLPQNQADVTTRMPIITRKLAARPQCSVCLKTFSRSGTLKVIVLSFCCLSLFAFTFLFLKFNSLSTVCLGYKSGFN